LEKDRAGRYQTAGDLRADLLRIQRDSTSAAAVALPTPAAARSSWMWPSIAASSLVAAIVAALTLWPRIPTVNPPADLKPIRLTANPSEYPVSGAALSPDGKFI